MIVVSCVPPVRPLFVKRAKDSTDSNTAATISNYRLSTIQLPEKAKTSIEVVHEDMDSSESSMGHKYDGKRDTMEPGIMAMARELTQSADSMQG